MICKIMKKDIDIFKEFAKNHIYIFRNDLAEMFSPSFPTWK